MSLPDLKQQLKNFILSSYGEGVLDTQFEELPPLQEEKPGFIPDLLATYCNSTEMILTEMQRLLEGPNINYSNANDYARQLKGSSMCIGARKVKAACVEFNQAFENNNYDQCIHCFHQIKDEFHIIQYKFLHIAQLERRILNLSTVP